MTAFALPFVSGVVRLRGRDTGGAFSMLEMEMAPHGGPHAHVHPREDEYFYVLSGDYEVVVDGVRRPAGPGDLVVVPQGTVHRITAGPAGGRHLTMFRPAGPEAFFEQAGALHRDGRLDEPAYRELLARYGITAPDGGGSPGGGQDDAAEVR